MRTACHSLPVELCCLRHFAHFAVKISERCSDSGGANMVFAVRLLQGRQRNYEESLGALVPEGGVVTRSLVVKRKQMKVRL